MSRSPRQFDPAYRYGKSIIDDITPIQLTATSVSQFVFICDQAYQLASVNEAHSSAGGASAAVTVRKITDASAPNASAGTTVVEQLTAPIDLTASVNTTRSSALVGGTANQFAAGDKVAVNFTGTLTGLLGILIIGMRRI